MFSVPRGLSSVTLAATASVVVHIAELGERCYGQVKVHVCRYPRFGVSEQSVCTSPSQFSNLCATKKWWNIFNEVKKGYKV